MYCYRIDYRDPYTGERLEPTESEKFAFLEEWQIADFMHACQQVSDAIIYLTRVKNITVEPVGRVWVDSIDKYVIIAEEVKYVH